MEDFIYASVFFFIQWNDLWGSLRGTEYEERWLVDSETLSYFINKYQFISIYPSGIILSTWPYVFLVLEHYTSFGVMMLWPRLLSAARRRWLKCSKVRIQWTLRSKHNNYDRNDSKQYWGLKPLRLCRLWTLQNRLQVCLYFHFSTWSQRTNMSV